jgi:hypothetical protein
MRDSIKLDCSLDPEDELSVVWLEENNQFSFAAPCDSAPDVVLDGVQAIELAEWLLKRAK